MTAEQFAALKPGDRVISTIFGSGVVVSEPRAFTVMCAFSVGRMPVSASEIDLPDTETPPLFEEDGA